MTGQSLQSGQARPLSLGAAVVASAIFSLTSTWMTYRTIRLRAFFFSTMLIAAALETFGLIGRAIAIQNPNQVTAFLIGYIAIILAPSIAAAACYMTFGRLVHFVTPPSALTARRLWVPPRRTTLIFVLFDVVSFLIQFLGLLIVAGAYGPDKSSEDKAAAIAKGQHVLQLGIVVQLLCFGLFAIVGARFLYVSRGWAAPGGTEWHLLAWVINVSAGLIMLRAIYRVVEFSGRGTSEYLASHEWFFWLCDALPMLIVFTSFTLVHPGSYLPPPFLRFRRKTATTKHVGDNVIVMDLGSA